MKKIKYYKDKMTYIRLLFIKYLNLYRLKRLNLTIYIKIKKIKKKIMSLLK